MQVEVINEASRVRAPNGTMQTFDRWIVRVTHVDGRVERIRCADEADAKARRDTYFA